MVHLNFSLCYSEVLISISSTNIIFKYLEKNGYNLNTDILRNPNFVYHISC